MYNAEARKERHSQEVVGISSASIPHRIHGGQYEEWKLGIWDKSKPQKALGPCLCLTITLFLVHQMVRLKTVTEVERLGP